MRETSDNNIDFTCPMCGNKFSTQQYLIDTNRMTMMNLTARQDIIGKFSISDRNIVFESSTRHHIRQLLRNCKVVFICAISIFVKCSFHYSSITSYIDIQETKPLKLFYYIRCLSSKVV